MLMMSNRKRVTRNTEEPRKTNRVKPCGMKQNLLVVGAGWDRHSDVGDIR